MVKFMLPNFEIEDSYGLKNIAGIDEAGRGPLCGDVFSACVLLDKNYLPNEINDSKKINENKREKIFDEILELEKNGKIFFGIGQGTVEEIESINIRNATKLAMQRAYYNFVDKYNLNVDLVLVDGNFVPEINAKTEFIIKGDAKCFSIATASIIAKVSRDRVLRKIDLEFPQYLWKKNKGYGTKSHLENIRKYGLCKYHRKSFIHF